jgi:hypothetical protein
MAIRRTKEARETAQQRRMEQTTYSFSADQKIQTTRAKLDTSDLIHFDVSLVKKDLLRTIVASLVVFGILIGLYFKL